MYKQVIKPSSWAVKYTGWIPLKGGPWEKETHFRLVLDYIPHLHLPKYSPAFVANLMLCTDPIRQPD